MRAPGWLHIVQEPSDAPGVITLCVTVRRWHPGFWLYILRRLIAHE